MGDVGLLELGVLIVALVLLLLLLSVVVVLVAGIGATTAGIVLG